MDSDKIRENLEIQLSELETLQSVFYNPGELRVDDATVLADIQKFVAKKYSFLPGFLDLTINLQIANQKFEFCINLPHEYPETIPDIYVRNHKLKKKQHANLNRDLTDFMTSEKRESKEPCIFSAVSWLQDNAENYLVSEEKEVKEVVVKDQTLVRFWIYSHHIYSKSKRREILDLALDLNVGGFCMPGKPGIICVEGTAGDCTEWWQTIKAMNWKRIFCKVSEECKDESDFKKFRTFREIVFQNSGIKCNHMDMGELLKYLEEHQLGYIFKELFGVETKSTVI